MTTLGSHFAEKLLPSLLNIYTLFIGWVHSRIDFSPTFIYFSFWSLNSLFPLCQTSFHSGPSTLNIILYLAQSILDRFNATSAGYLTTMEFSKVFDSVWLPALFPKLISAFIHALFDGLSLFFLTGACAVFQNYKVAPLEFIMVLHKESLLGHVLFSFDINDLLGAVEVSQEALIQLEC